MSNTNPKTPEGAHPDAISLVPRFPGQAAMWAYRWRLPRCSALYTSQYRCVSEDPSRAIRRSIHLGSRAKPNRSPATQPQGMSTA